MLSSIRAKLISIFVLIKVVPLLALAVFAWQAAEQLGTRVGELSTGMADKTLGTIKVVGDTVIQDASRALDDRSREAIERLTTDTARAIANFLYDRDQDVLQAAQVNPTEAAYRKFLNGRERTVFVHGPWKLADDRSHWEPTTPEDSPAAAVVGSQAATAENTDNAKDFHVRPPEYLGRQELRPLYVEMTFVGLNGKERVRVKSGTQDISRLADIRDQRQTFAKAESYWPDLQKLKPGEIFVSEVIGSYVGSHIVGSYTPQAAAKAGIPFAPEQSAYAGTENPIGQRFRGIIRWATPVEQDGKVAGYVTLALDHDHLRQFTDRLMPTEARYTPITDAIQGNYAFLWDHKGRAISHPRDYFIAGYNAETGQPETPWMDQSLYETWQASGEPSYKFLARTPPFLEPSLQKRPAQALVTAGTIALDCRYLNFSPQCQGWDQLTRKGGSGSFVIFFTGLWKLTTAAAIPYHTGQYAVDPRGFGFVTIGANVAAFHEAATASGQRIAHIIEQKDIEHKEQMVALVAAIDDNLSYTAGGLLLSTGVLIVLVILIAIWMAGILTRRITSMAAGIQRFQDGNLGHRLAVRSRDEMGLLAASFNRMADAMQDAFARMSDELEGRKQAEQQLMLATADLRLSEERLTLATAGAHIGIWDYDAVAGTYVCNTEMLLLFGFNSGGRGITLEDWLAWVHPEDRDFVRADIAAALNGQRPLDSEFRIVRSDAAPRYIKSQAQVHWDGDNKPVRMVGISMDITERREMIETLRNAKETAERASQAKSAFLSSMTHELRTPLNSIIAFTEFVSNESFGPVGNPEYIEHGDYAGESAHHLLKIINDILDFSKIESGTITLERAPVAIAPIVRQCARMVHNLADRRGITINIAIPANIPTLWADEGALTKILVNLLGNAIKFNVAGGSILVTALEADDFIDMVVADTGVGIPTDAFERVTKPFEQVNNRYSRAHGGTGLGLSIVEGLSKLHGGCLTIASVLEKGTSMTVRIPRYPNHKIYDQHPSK